MRSTPFPRVFAILLFLAPFGYSESLLLDFGTTPGLVAPADALNSPGHFTGAVPAGEITWNLVTSTDITSGLKFGDGSDATGISLNLGQEDTIGNNIVDFAAANAINSTSLTGTSATTLGSDYGTASSSPVAKDGIFRNGTNATQNAAIGFRIDGLTAGTYTLYFVGRNTNTSAGGFPVMFYTSTGLSADTFAFTGSASTTVGNSSTNGNTTWTAGNQYNTATVNVSTGDSIFVAAEGTSASELRGFINSVEIVPEPSAVFILLAGFGVLLVLRPKLNRKRLSVAGDS
ncbi:hypothetical protein [Chthoniobacter flavus]|uniref:hypothetical protein n=1 Tax=Chthoniobacter flavus TaxID=191863 RepID=UPI00104EF000|nr:hypothetical protein [Chthoniobacter flavus]